MESRRLPDRQGAHGVRWTPSRSRTPNKHRKPSSLRPTLGVGATVAGGVLGAAAILNPVETPTAEAVSTDAGDTGTVLALDPAGRSSEVTRQAVRATADQLMRKAVTERARADAEAKAAARKAADREAAARKAARAEAAAAEARARTARKVTEGASARTANPAAGSDRAAVTVPKQAPEAAAASGAGAAVVAFVRARLGDAYVMGSTGPHSWDCSGLVQAAFKSAGRSLPRTSGAQSAAGVEVGLGELRPGDILYWGGKGSAHHVAVYVGGGKFIGAQNPSTGVVERPLSHGGVPTGAVRVL
ncbi:C40 family peptidase [Streptomyces sp. NPDC090021]|uniref:C40 family peptidase n=1 Tax=Streptomyces sp. NPDC090021 TaxID=3365919 RepID=UPI0038191E90